MANTNDTMNREQLSSGLAQSSSLSIPTDALAMLPRLRDEAAAEIERLIGFLDATEDTDTDAAVEDGPMGGDDWEIEDNGDGEPMLGSVATNENTSQAGWSQGGSDDREGDEHDGREPDVDDEPSLGSFDRLMDQRHSWRQRAGWSGHFADAEVDNADKEPSLGSPESYGPASQESWAQSGSRDLEEDDPADSRKVVQS